MRFLAVILIVCLSLSFVCTFAQQTSDDLVPDVYIFSPLKFVYRLSSGVRQHFTYALNDFLDSIDTLMSLDLFTTNALQAWLTLSGVSLRLIQLISAPITFLVLAVSDLGYAIFRPASHSGGSGGNVDTWYGHGQWSDYFVRWSVSASFA